MSGLFQKIDFKSHSGLDLTWKIEMDALGKKDWKCLAHMIMEYEHRPFCEVIGIPSGGVYLGALLSEYSTKNKEHPYLLVDDVLTTGRSMEEYAKKYNNNVIGWVVFSRTRLHSDWITPLFEMP